MTGTHKALRRMLVLRFVLLAAMGGLLVGLYEAALLHSTPRVPALLEPDVRYVIWFIAPLTDILVFAFLGFLLGLVAAIPTRPRPTLGTALVSAGLGAGSAYAVAAGDLMRVWDVTSSVVARLTTAGICYVTVFACAFLVLTVWRRRLGWLFDAQASWPFVPIASILLVLTGLFVGGMSVYALSRPITRALSPPYVLVAGPRPNIVLISLDSVRADHLSAHGYSRPTTPNLDRLAAAGVRFENAFAASSWSLPSHASMLTGLLPHQHGANWAVPLGTAPWTLAEVLGSYGYETAGFSSNLGYGLAGWGMAQGFEVYEDDSSSIRHNLARTLFGHAFLQPVYRHLFHFNPFDRRSAAEVNRDVLRWHRRRSRRPFFLFINYIDAHDVYLAPPPYDRRFGQISGQAVRRAAATQSLHATGPLSGEGQASLVAGYDNCLAYLDDQLGELLAFLARSPDWLNTIVIITSDHGEAFGEHGVYAHGLDLHREVLHVPLTLFGRGIPEGRTIVQVVSIVDVFPTVLDLALGEELPFHRFSLRRFWTNGLRPEPFEEDVVSQLVPHPAKPDAPVLISLMSSEWHYIQDSQGRTELYHRPTDAQEKANLAGSPEQQVPLQTLRRRLEARVRLSHRPWRGPEYLEALDRPGYSFLRETIFSLKRERDSPSAKGRAGSAQAYFRPADSTAGPPQSPEEDLIKSLPYQ